MAEAERVEVVIVGAGLAGLACAYHLADAGLETLVVERGDFAGSKNVTGGRIYLNPVRRFFPPIWEEAPLERHVTKERLTAMGEGSSVSFELASERFKDKPYHSHTILRAKFDPWLAERAAEKGALIVPKNRVDDLLWQEGKVIGIVASEAEIHADVVVAADGALSFLVEKAGLGKRREPQDYAVGVKEVIELPGETIEERFGLSEGEGAAQLFFGSITEGMFGGGFLYTNIDTISLGVVVGIGALMEKGPGFELHRLLDSFKERPEVKPLIEGGDPVEYSAHIVPEGGLESMPQVYGDGILVVGDAAGLALNTGLIVRGMDFALASGALAAQTIVEAKKRNDYSSASLSRYEGLLKESFVLKDLETEREMPHFLRNPRLFTLYPQALAESLERLMWIGEEPKGKFSTTLWKEARRVFRPSVVGDLWRVWRI
jgi:electron transfer flavoprotein-quinone oxidoreductase